MLNRATQLADRLGSPAAACGRAWGRVCAARARPAGRVGGVAGASNQRGSSVTGTWCDDTPGGKLARLEAALFLAREPLSTRRLAELAGLADGTEARALIRI